MTHPVILVPARLASSRFPEKLLHPLGGVPLLCVVARRLRQQVPDWPVVFAVDDPRLAKALDGEKVEVIMTRSDHVSGTDRLAEANRQVKADLVVNVQADEPLVSRDQLEALVAALTPEVVMSTLVTPFRCGEDFIDPNQVKCVRSKSGQALYFSRSPIPFPRDGMPSADDPFWQETPPWRHLGLYAYRGDFLQTFSSLPKGKLEETEKLEQLRVLENGYQIGVGVTDQPSVGIDHLSDVARYEAIVANRTEPL